MRLIATRRSGTILAALAAALMLLAPAAGAVEEPTEDPDADDTQQGDTQESDEDSGEEGSAEELTTQPVEDICDDVIFRVTPHDMEGDDTAVALTSQQLDADFGGWVHVSWQVNEGTELTGITLRTEAGTTTLVSDLEAGTVEDVLELYFCGTSANAPGSDGEEAPAEEPAEEPEEPAEEPVEEPEPIEEPEPVEEPTDDGGSAGSSSSSGNQTGGSSDSTEPADDTTTSTSDATSEEDAGDDEAEVASEPETEADVDDASEDAPEPTTDDDSAEAAEDDTEVLGVMMTRDDEAGVSWLPGVIALVLLLLLGAGGFAAYRAGLIGGNR